MIHRTMYFAVLTALIFAFAVPVAAQLEEVLVTAEKREESLQDVSIFVSAFDEELLKFGGIEDVSRPELLVPGLNYSFAGNDAKFPGNFTNSLGVTTWE